MNRIQLIFHSIQQVLGNEELSVVILTDIQRQKSLSVVCDSLIARQILLRLQSPQICGNMLPEALLQMLPEEHEMMIYGVHDGQYQVVLLDNHFERNVRIRMSDAVLLTIISNIPLYIEEGLMERQSTSFDEHATGVAIPINAMDLARLNIAMEKAIEEENYELASKLRDEIEGRKAIKK